ncbi:AAA family ATPase [Cronobacter sakazakii]|nr:AAA family ATPase [Cronobacter sakazakii]
MEFRYVNSLPTQGIPKTVYLLKENWNDWFYWETLFTMIYCDLDGKFNRIGELKIAQKSMKSESECNSDEEKVWAKKPDIPDVFPFLNDVYFSLGQSENYYETLNALPELDRRVILQGVRDCAFDLKIFNLYKEHPAMTGSLLRSISERTVVETWHELAYGKEFNKPFNFSYLFPFNDNNDNEVRLTFNVTPHDTPPSNIQAIIGRNGVGKTTLFAGIIKGIINQKAIEAQHVGLLQVPAQSGQWIDNHSYFTSLTLLSFSPFDRFGPVEESKIPSGVKYQYIGLMKKGKIDINNPKRSELRPKTFDELHIEFCESMSQCLIGARRQRWEDCLKILENDPLFKEADISKLANIKISNFSESIEESANYWLEQVRQFLNKLSSGHLVTLISITKLIEVTEDRSLTLIDEPEAHLHPPLISAYIRAVSHLMSERNGVAIVATHSPVVLQEVRSDCAWVLNRTGRYMSADRPDIETFGENVGTLTRAVFSHEVVNTGFYKMISDAAEEYDNFDELDHHFDNKLGGEARALARTLIKTNNKKGIDG